MKTQATATRKIRGIGSSQLAEALATLMGAVADKNPERGRRVQKLRKLAGFSSAQKLAEHLHVGIRTVQYWEAGHEIGPDNLPRLARALKVRPHDIDPPSSALLTATIEEHEEDELSAGDITRLEAKIDALADELRRLVTQLAEAAPTKTRPARKPLRKPSEATGQSPKKAQGAR